MFEQLLSELASRPAVQGITMIDVLGMPAPLDSLLRHMIRRGALPLGGLAQELALAEDQARTIGTLLVEKGLATVEEPVGGEPIYHVRFATARRRALPARLLEGHEN